MAEAINQETRPTVNFRQIVHVLSKIMGEQGLNEYNMVKVVQEHQKEIEDLMPLTEKATKGIVHLIKLKYSVDAIQVMGTVVTMMGAGAGMFSGASGLMGGSLEASSNGMLSAGMGAQGASNIFQGGITYRKGQLQEQMQQVSVATSALEKVNSSDMHTVNSSATTNEALAKAASQTIYYDYMCKNLRG